MELMQPGKEPYAFQAHEFFDEKGEPLEVARHPGMKLRFQLPFQASPYGILRRKKRID